MRPSAGLAAAPLSKLDLAAFGLDFTAAACLQVEDLKRFMPQLLHIVRPGAHAAAPRFTNVGSAASLAAAFGSS